MDDLRPAEQGVPPVLLGGIDGAGCLGASRERGFHHRHALPCGEEHHGGRFITLGGSGSKQPGWEGAAVGPLRYEARPLPQNPQRKLGRRRRAARRVPGLSPVSMLSLTMHSPVSSAASQGTSIPSAGRLMQSPGTRSAELTTISSGKKHGHAQTRHLGHAKLVPNAFTPGALAHREHHTHLRRGDGLAHPPTSWPCFAAWRFAAREGAVSSHPRAAQTAQQSIHKTALEGSGLRTKDEETCPTIGVWVVLAQLGSEGVQHQHRDQTASENGLFH